MVRRGRMPALGPMIVLILALLVTACAGGSSASSTVSAASSFHSTLKTSDRAFLIQFSVSPNRFGLNMFTVQVKDASSGKPGTGLQVQLSTTMLDMAMGTDTFTLQATGNGMYSGQGELSMSGHWQITIVLRTSDGSRHEAKVEFDTPS